MPACMRWARSRMSTSHEGLADRHGARRAQLPSAARCRSRCSRPSGRRRRLPRALLGASGGAISTASSTAARRRRSSAAASGTCRCRSTPRRCTRRRSSSSAITTSPPSAPPCQAQSPVKTLDRLDVARDGEEIHIVAAARSFLHHQVRNMVGTLEAGRRRQVEPRRRRALRSTARDRTRAARPRRPDGLYLVAVRY